MKKLLLPVAWAALAFSVPACQTSHKVDVETKPIEIKPITININIRVDRALDDFFGDLDAARETNEAKEDQQ